MTADRSLRLALQGNATFSLACAALMLSAGPTVAAWLGIDAVWIVRAVGAALIPFALDLIYQATRPQLTPWRAYGASLGDMLWVAGTAVLLLGWPGLLSPLGTALTVGVAVAVFGFGAWQAVAAARVSAYDQRV